MGLGDPKKIREADRAINNIVLCFAAALCSLLLWGFLWLFGG